MTGIDHYIDSINDYNNQGISIFVGAGLSISSGMPSWQTLVGPYADQLNIKNNNIPYERIMQYALSEKASHSLFLSDLTNRIEKCKPSAIHRLIARLNLPRIWTTNYDGLLEQAYQDECMKYQLVAEDADMFHLDYQRNQIIKMHGSLTEEKRSDIILLESEYESFHVNRHHVLQLLENDIQNKTMLYLGVSFNDHNLRKVVSAIWNRRDTGRPSFLFTIPETDENQRVLYDRWKTDLSRYNICFVEVNNYTEIDDFMHKLIQKRFGKTALIFGKRSDEKYFSLAKTIGYKLAANGYKIHSGGGPGVALPVSEGAWEYMESNGIPSKDKVVFFYRINGGSTNPLKGQIIYMGQSRTEVRKKMITADKICIVMGEESDTECGIKEEIQIAYTKGARIIPVGCTGATARKQWEIQHHYYKTGGPFHSMEKEYLTLNSDDASEVEIADSVVALANYLLVNNDKSI